MDFIHALMDLMSGDESLELNKAVKQAYDIGLGPPPPMGR